MLLWFLLFFHDFSCNIFFILLLIDSLNWIVHRFNCLPKRFLSDTEKPSQSFFLPVSSRRACYLSVWKVDFYHWGELEPLLLWQLVASRRPCFLFVSFHWSGLFPASRQLASLAVKVFSSCSPADSRNPRKPLRARFLLIFSLAFAKVVHQQVTEAGLVTAGAVQRLALGAFNLLPEALML